MRRAVALLFALSGCADLFNLEPVTLTADAASDSAPPCATPRGHDEDGDLVDDGCDVCPGDPDVEQIDSDGDAVGDECDPHPGLATDRLIQFFAFADASEGDHFALQPGWSVTSDALVYDQLSATTYIPLADPTPGMPYNVQVGVTIDSADRTMYDQISVAGNALADGDHLECVVFHATGGIDALQAVAGAQMDDGPLLANTYVDGTHFIARMTFQRTGVKCDVDAMRPSGDTSSAMAVVTNATAVGGTLSLNVQRTKIHIAWLALYTLLP